LLPYHIRIKLIKKKIVIYPVCEKSWFYGMFDVEITLMPCIQNLALKDIRTKLDGDKEIVLLSAPS